MTALADAKQGFLSNLEAVQHEKEPAETPPAGVLNVVHYSAKPGHLVAYVTPDPKDGKKYPAIVWIVGGETNTIGDVWTEQPAEDDQTASAFRKAGIVTLYPSQRGGNDNPGQQEGFLGEVEDVIAAANYVRSLPYVNPDRVYLGGHSTGGTLALLIAETTNQFRGIFSFGPVENVEGYPKDFLPYNANNATENRLRSPVHWLDDIQTHTFVFEGADGGNLSSLMKLMAVNKNGKVHFTTVMGADHFVTLAPITKLIAQKIWEDQGKETNIYFSDGEIARLFPE